MSNDQSARPATGTELPMPGRTAAGAQPVSAEWVAEVAREVIRRLAPRELAVFDTVADAWLSEGGPPRRPRRMPGAAVGFGVDAVLLSELAFPVITGAVGEVLGNVMWERVRPRRRAARPPAAPQVITRQATTPEDGAGAGRAGAGGDTQDRAGKDPAAEAAGRAIQGVELTEQQTRDLHDACRRHGITLGLPAATAELLADAVVGALHSTPSGP